EWGFDDQEVFDAIKEARNAPLDAQEAAYMHANEAVMDALPGVPLASPVPSLVVAPGVEGYPISPVPDEAYNVISLGGDESQRRDREGVRYPPAPPGVPTPPGDVLRSGRGWCRAPAPVPSSPGPADGRFDPGD